MVDSKIEQSVDLKIMGLGELVRTLIELQHEKANERRTISEYHELLRYENRLYAELNRREDNYARKNHSHNRFSMRVRRYR